MNNSFLTAAASYYGLNPDTTEVEWQNVNGEFVFAFQVKASPDDLRGVLSRMKTIEDAEAQKQSEPEPKPAFATEDIRKHYDKLTPTERSQYGSFACFKHAVLSGLSTIGTETDSSSQEDWPAVWLKSDQVTEAQKANCVDYRAGATGDDYLYLIQWSMLTDEQKAKAREVKR